MSDDARKLEDELYKYVLKVILLEYSNEVRFRTPIISAASQRNSAATLPKRNSLLESKLPSYVMKNLKIKLQDIMTKKINIADDKLRRTLLRLYGDLLDSKSENELRNIDFLVPKFAAYANQELRKLGLSKDDDVSKGVFQQTSEFIDIIIDILKTKKDPDANVLAKLNECKNEFHGRRAKLERPEELKYPSKPYRVDDMNERLLQIVQTLFNVNNTKIQTDVFKYKDIALTHCLYNDVDRLCSMRQHDDSNDVSNYSDDDDSSEYDYLNEDALAAWRKRCGILKSQVQNRYKIVKSTNTSLPAMPSNEKYYVVPLNRRQLFIELTRLVMSKEYDQDVIEKKNSIKNNNNNNNNNNDNNNNNNKNNDETRRGILDPSYQDFLNIVARVWLIDYPTRAVALYYAGHVNNVFTLVDTDPSKGLKNTQGIDLETSTSAMEECQNIIKDGDMNWNEKRLWNIEDQKLWTECLLLSYNILFTSLKGCLSNLFDETRSIKFNPYLQFLGEYIESDILFSTKDTKELTLKWEKRLTKTLIKASGRRYETYLRKLPRDDNLNVLHLLNICDAITSDIKKLQKKYKNPFLGFLHIGRTVASVTTGMFANDAKVIFDHIEKLAAKRNERISTADALEIYQSLREIRDIFNQVIEKNAKFTFPLERTFYKYLDAWVEESNEKLLSIVQEALNKDDYEPIEVENNGNDGINNSNWKNSRAVLDIVTIIKQFITLLKKQNWGDEVQLAEVYTKLLRNISNCAMLYAAKISSKVNEELLSTNTKSDTDELQSQQREKKLNWLDEVKNVVSNIQNFAKSPPEVVFNFEPQTCVALNNVSAMMQNLARLEESIDPERISQTLLKHNRKMDGGSLHHVFTIRIVKGENLLLSKDTGFGKLNPYVSLVDVGKKVAIARTRAIKRTSDPDWDEEFEISTPVNTTLELSAIVWSDSFGQHQMCGKSLFELDPKKFKHNGFPEEITLNLDLSGRLVLEVSVETETMDAMFVMGRSYRSLKRVEMRSAKLMVEKFSGFIENCFSRANLKAVCGKGQPAISEFEASIENLCDYLNLNLSVLKQYLCDDIFMEVMIATWKVVLKYADQLMLPKLSKAKADVVDSNSWQSMSTKLASVSLTTMNMFGINSPLSAIEVETVLRWLDLLMEFFHNEGNGPPLEELKTDEYQALLLIPAFHDQNDEVLIDEVERLSPAYMQMLVSRNAVSLTTKESDGFLKRAGSLSRSKTIYANSTAKNRAQAAKDTLEAKADPHASMILKEDIILRVLLARGRKDFVRTRLNQRTKIAYSLATERMARLAAEGSRHY